MGFGISVDDDWNDLPVLPLRAYCTLCRPLWSSFETIDERDAHVQECHPSASD